jgi:hypothetical protein
MLAVWMAGGVLMPWTRRSRCACAHNWRSQGCRMVLIAGVDLLAGTIPVVRLAESPAAAQTFSP